MTEKKRRFFDFWPCFHTDPSCADTTWSCLRTPRTPSSPSHAEQEPSPEAAVQRHFTECGDSPGGPRAPSVGTEQRGRSPRTVHKRAGGVTIKPRRHTALKRGFKRGA